MNIPFIEIVKAVYAIDYTAPDRFIDITSVEFDARLVRPGALFIPLTGGRTDGHTYIQQAIDNGAVATLWSQDPQTVPGSSIAAIYVDDTLEAFQALARMYLKHVNPQVIAVTGSNGKTTTKDMIAHILAARHRVHKTEGNFNNEIGLPYTVLTMPEDTEVAVLEMGMDGFGHIKLLSELVEPDIAVITLVGESHLEFLGSREGIAQAKGEILYGLKENGLLLYPNEEKLLPTHLPPLPKAYRSLTVGFSPEADLYAFDLLERQKVTYFKTNWEPTLEGSIPIMGAYNVSNALFALAVSRTLGIDAETAYERLAHFQLTANRLEWKWTRQGAVMLNDAYNASPSSMKAAVSTFSQIEIPEIEEKWVVLGDIRELGPHAEAYHRQIADVLDPQQLSKIYLFGGEMHALYDELLKRGDFDPAAIYYEASDHDALCRQLDQDLRAGIAILLKSSFGVNLLSVVEHLEDSAK